MPCGNLAAKPNTSAFAHRLQRRVIEQIVNIVNSCSAFIAREPSMFSIHSNDLTSELARRLLTVHLVGMHANSPASAASRRGFVHSDAFADYRSAASTKCFTLHLRPEPTRRRYVAR